MASNPTTPLSARKQFLSTLTTSNDGSDQPDDGGTAAGSTRIPIARNGSIRCMRNSKSFSNDHQLSKSLTQSDHYYVSQLNKKDFLTLDKFGSAGSMHKAHMASGGAASRGHSPLANGVDVTDSTARPHHHHHQHHNHHNNKLSLQATVATVVAATNGKACNGGDRSLVGANFLV